MPDVTPPDLTTYSLDDLNALQESINAEFTRRANLNSIPTQVATLAASYVAAGGDKAELTTALG